MNGRKSWVFLSAGLLAVGGLRVSEAPAAVSTFGGWQAEWSNTLDNADGTYVTLTVLGLRNGQWVAMEKVAVFADPASRSGIGAIEINFTQISPNAVPQLVITQENITNATGVDWTGFNFSITGGVAGSAGLPHFDLDGTFNNSAPFSINPFELTGATTEVTTEATVVRGIELGNGTLADGAIWWPGVPKGSLVIVSSPNLNGPMQSFRFIEQPRITESPIPEPASATAALAGGFLLLGYRCRNSEAGPGVI